MAKYVTLINFTEKGAAHIKDSTKRAQAFDEAAEAHGVKIAGQYWTMGAHDGVLILEADTEEAALRCVVDLSSGGNVKTQTMQAFDAAEFDQIVS